MRGFVLGIPYVIKFHDMAWQVPCTLDNKVAKQKRGIYCFHHSINKYKDICAYGYAVTCSTVQTK